MKTFLVGGAVRDSLLGRPIKDRDFVVVGSTPTEMLAAGYKQVGADFPVFLDEDGTEYALARTERKVGAGYHGFEVSADPTVTLEDDLRRRDLTINAMAQDPDTGEIIDPFNGQQDLRDGILRHVSDAFAEDPVRVLRVARFAARYGFTVAFDTRAKMYSLLPELQNLTAERVWLELEKALMEPQPDLFVSVLQDVGAWHVLFPEVDPTGITLLTAATKAGMTFDQRMVALLSKTTPKLAGQFFNRLKAPADVTRLWSAFHKADVALAVFVQSSEKAQVLYDLLRSTDAYRRPQAYLSALDILKLANTTDTTIFTAIFTAFAYRALDVASTVSFADLPVSVKNQGGAAVGHAITKERYNRINKFVIEATDWLREIA